jgi:alpha-L-fucosidase
MKSLTLMTLLATTAATLPAHAQIVPKALTGSQLHETIAQRDARMQWWRDARFGLFIHWNPSSLKGTEISISRSPNPYGPNEGGILAAEYDQLYKQFNPEKFDAKAVVALAKAAGMKYVVFTTKHHDGFSMFDSALTDYKITSPESPYRKDITRQLAEATRAAGLHWCVYYSQPDLHHPDYGKNQAEYNRYFHGQVHELQTKYGPTDSVWFDGLGGSAAQWEGEKLFAQMRADNPNVIINDRNGLPGDYYTPEQRIGAYDDRRDWETCMTIGDQWAYKPNDNYKTAAQCIQALARCSGGDGNFLLNIGLRPDGTVDPTQQSRLGALGAWMQTNGEAIYGARGGPFKPAAAYASTRRSNVIYVHVFGWKNGEVQLPALPAKVVKSSVLGGGIATVKQDGESLTIAVPAALHHGAATVVALQLESSAMDLPTISPTTLKAITTASDVYNNDITYDASKAFDADPGTRWATPNGTKSAWLQVDLMKPTTIKGVTINEAFAGRVRKFEVQVQPVGRADWVTLVQGDGIGSNYQKSFGAVNVKAVKLNILDSTEGPTISEVTFDVVK